MVTRLCGAICLMLLSGAMIPCCSGDGGRADCLDLFGSIGKARSIEEERKALEDIRSFAYRDTLSDLFVSAQDEKGRRVIQDLSRAEGEISVTITITRFVDKTRKERLWAESIRFVPRSRSTVKVLLRE